MLSVQTWSKCRTACGLTMAREAATNVFLLWAAFRQYSIHTRSWRSKSDCCPDLVNLVRPHHMPLWWKPVSVGWWEQWSDSAAINVAATTLHIPDVHTWECSLECVHYRIHTLVVVLIIKSTIHQMFSLSLAYWNPRQCSLVELQRYNIEIW